MRLLVRFGVILVLFAAMSVPSVFAADAPVTREMIEQCLSADTAEARNTCYDTLCDFSFVCARSLVNAATEARGPIIGTLVLRDLYDRGDRTVTKDGHDLQHQIGRTAARTSGGDWEIFLKCPDDFFLGCKHGFFEAMLGELGTSVDAASSVCEKAPRTEQVFCFHGMGHGIMMAQANDVHGSLEVCDELRGSKAKRGCYQGVFMENVNAAGRGETRKGVLDPTDVLAPCNRIHARYRSECYGQHADYVLKTLSGFILSAVGACERAESEAWIGACVRHLGQNMTTYDYQTMYLGSYELTTAPAGAVALCARFPASRRQDCLIGAAHNFMLYDLPEQAITLCNLTGGDMCPSVVIPYLSRPLYTPDDRTRICTGLTDTDARELCLHPVKTPLMKQLSITIPAVIILGIIAFFLARSRIKRGA